MLNKTTYMVLLVKWILFISESTNKANWKIKSCLLAIGSLQSRFFQNCWSRVFKNAGIGVESRSRF